MPEALAASVLASNKITFSLLGDWPWNSKRKQKMEKKEGTEKSEATKKKKNI